MQPSDQIALNKVLNQRAPERIRENQGEPKKTKENQLNQIEKIKIKPRERTKEIYFKINQSKKILWQSRSSHSLLSEAGQSGT